MTARASLQERTSDVVIVGSGAGGAAAAHRLAQRGLRVVLLEKGAELPMDGSTLNVDRVVRRGEFLSREPWLDGNGRRFAPEEHFNVGGKTRWYGAALFRFSPQEFAGDESRGYSAWPIGLADLEPYYRDAEALLGVRTFAAEPDLSRIIRRLTNGRSGWIAEPMPMGLAASIALHSEEASHFDGFASVLKLKADAEYPVLRPLVDAGRVELVTGADATTLVAASGEPERICGVRLRDGREYRAQAIVLAAGALHSPRLLQRYLAVTGLDRQLSNAALVGANLKLHLLSALVAISPSRKTDLIRKTMVLTHERFAHSTVQPLGFDGELIAQLMPSIVPRPFARAMGARAYGFFLQTEDSSDIRNRVLDRATQDATLPQLDYDERRGAAAAREHRAFSLAFQRALFAAGSLSFRKRIGISGTAHACGTLVCGDSPATSVVDPHGRVHGLSGLYVADGSVLPRSSRVNPALTIYAWGLRLGDRLAGTLTAPAQKPQHLTEPSSVK
jgi:choline dehydrogenase-like flavoprotein